MFCQRQGVKVSTMLKQAKKIIRQVYFAVVSNIFVI